MMHDTQLRTLGLNDVHAGAPASQFLGSLAAPLLMLWHQQHAISPDARSWHPATDRG